MRIPLGKLLLDGGFINPEQYVDALKLQRKSKRLLGQILIAQRAITELELNAVMALQLLLIMTNDPTRMGMDGGRRQLGEVLIEANCLTRTQLDFALLKQVRTKQPLGSILVDWQLVSQDKLEMALVFQRGGESKEQGLLELRLGNLLVAQGSLTPKQLQQVLAESEPEKIGELLVRKGWVKQDDIDAAQSLQRKLVKAALMNGMFADADSDGLTFQEQPSALDGPQGT
jgi:hypothetical protein